MLYLTVHHLDNASIRGKPPDGCANQRVSPFGRCGNITRNASGCDPSFEDRDVSQHIPALFRKADEVSKKKKKRVAGMAIYDGAA